MTTSDTVNVEQNAAANAYWPNTYPVYTYPMYTYTTGNGEVERMRLALELVAEADSLDEAKRIAAKALRVSGS